jgi:hypothetical protein
VKDISFLTTYYMQRPQFIFIGIGHKKLSNAVFWQQSIDRENVSENEKNPQAVNQSLQRQEFVNLFSTE